MDLTRCGKMLCALRKAKGMTQKDVADKVGVMPKTVSKWETGHGFPDVSVISALADVLGVSERILLSGDLAENPRESGNMKKIRFFVCPECGSVVQGTGEYQVVCCGKPIDALQSKPADDNHPVTVSKADDEYYVEFTHDMTKDHFIGFVAYVGYDRVMTIRLYSEQTPSVYLPSSFRGTLYFWCNTHGLYEYKI